MVIRDKNFQVRVLYIGDPGADQEQITVALEAQVTFPD